MLKLKWLKTELLSLKLKTTIEDMKNLFSTRPSKEKNVSKPISNNIKNSTSNGTRISSKHKRKTQRLSVSWRTVTLSNWPLTGTS
jgi:hypothetical protein